MDISSGKIFFKKVKVIPEVNFNEEFNSDLHFDLEVDLHGFLKVNFVILNGNTLSLHLQSMERKILRSDTYPSHRSIVTLKVNQRLFEINKVFQEVSAIPEVFFNEEFNGDLHFHLEVGLHGFLKVNFVFLDRNPLFLQLQYTERKILHSDTHPSHMSIVTFKVYQRLFEIIKVFQEVSVISEVNFREKFIGELGIDLVTAF